MTQKTDEPSPIAAEVEAELDSGRLDIARYAKERDARLGSANFLDQFLRPLWAVFFGGSVRFEQPTSESREKSAKD